MSPSRADFIIFVVLDQDTVRVSLGYYEEQRFVCETQSELKCFLSDVQSGSYSLLATE